MIIGIGTDIAEVERIKSSLETYGERFRDRVFNPIEIEYCLQKACPFESFAARFAVKEATIKALGTIGDSPVSFKDITVQNGPSGMPSVLLSGKALLFYQKSGATHCHVSITHTKNVASATVILEKR